MCSECVCVCVCARAYRERAVLRVHTCVLIVYMCVMSAGVVCVYMCVMSVGVHVCMCSDCVHV